MFCRFKDWRRGATRFDRNVNLYGHHRHRYYRHLVAQMRPDPRLAKKSPFAKKGRAFARPKF